ncbi:hypothetical protein SH528x_000445 [Novipirellula sp. SH528]|uniref:hypothetical protein n=1 Tax=Novipirellula sp. SH528 TaxID=3454466 RepID=UPI003F9EF45F
MPSVITVAWYKKLDEVRFPVDAAELDPFYPVDKTVIIALPEHQLVPMTANGHTYHSVVATWRRLG